MNESSLGIAGAAQISPLVDVVDLDGHLLNANDTHTGLAFVDGCVAPRRRAGPGRRPAGAVAVKRYVILAEGAFDEEAKTATGVMRYAESPTVAVIDSDPRRHGRRRPRARPRERRPGRARRSPTRCRSGRRRSSSGSPRRAASCPMPYRTAIIDALANGLDVESGLHDFLGDDPEFAAAAHLSGRELRDLRRVPHGLNVPTGANLAVPAHTVLTVGSDCALGKMTVCLELDAEARRRGLASVFVPTGQTGIAIAGWGIAVDEVISDFVAGAPSGSSSRATSAAATGRSCGSRARARSTTRSTPASRSGCCTARRRTRCVFVHEPGRETIDGDPRYAIPPLTELIDDQVRMARHVRPAPVVAVALKTNRLDEDAARAAIAEVERETGLVADDPVRFGAGRILDAVLSARR